MQCRCDRSCDSFQDPHNAILTHAIEFPVCDTHSLADPLVALVGTLEARTSGGRGVRSHSAAPVCGRCDTEVSTCWPAIPMRYQSQRRVAPELLADLRQVAMERPRFGYRRLHVMLRRKGWSVNKLVLRLVRENGWLVRRRQRKKLAAVLQECVMSGRRIARRSTRAIARVRASTPDGRTGAGAPARAR